MLLFSPFYFGHKLKLSTLDKIRSIHKTIVIVLGMLAIVVEIILLKIGLVDITWATHDYSSSFWDCVLKYIYMFGFTIPIFFLLSVLTPDFLHLKRWGRNSLVVYLIHPFLVDVVRALIKRFILENTMIEYIISLMCAVLIVDILSSNIFRRIYDNCFKSIYKLLRLN